MHAASPPLSDAAVAALRNPPEVLAEDVQRELESVWAERSRRFLKGVLQTPQGPIVSQLWIDYLAGRPYLHFKASGRNSGFAAEPEQIIVVLFIGASRSDIDAEFGEWFTPFDDGAQYIRPIEFGAQRAAETNMTDDGTTSIYWQQDNAFIEVRNRTDALGLASRVHAQAQRIGIYEFPQSYLGMSYEGGSLAPAEPVDANPAARIPAVPGVSADVAPDPHPATRQTPVIPAQPSQEELAGGWERISQDPESLTLSPNTAREFEGGGGNAEIPQTTPRIPAATLGLALHATIRRNEISPVESLLRAGADVEARDSEGKTPLMTASLSGSPALIQRLIDAGANLEAVPSGGLAPAADQGMTALMFAAREGREAAVRTLIEAGSSLNAVNDLGRTALEIAGSEGQTATARLIRRAVLGDPLDTPDSAPLAASERVESEPDSASEVAQSEESLPESETGGPTENRDFQSNAPGIDPAPTESGNLQAAGDTETDEEGPAAIEEVETFTALLSSIGSVRVWQARLEAAWRRLQIDINQDTDATILRAVILNWDARIEPESRGVLGYEYWRAAIADLSPKDPVTAPEPSPNLSDERVIQALRNAASRLVEDYGSVDVAYQRKIY